MVLQLKFLAGTLVFAYVLLCVGLFAFQRKLLYLPMGEWDGKGISLESEVGPIRVSVVGGAAKRGVIYFGGNAEDVRWSAPLLGRIFAGDALYLMHYRGYGGSAGSPSEAGLVSDASQLYDLVAGQHEEVMVIGRSLGSGIAVRLASEKKVAGLVLVTPFDSVLRVAQERFSFVPVGLLLEDKYESIRYAPKVRAKTLLIAAERDQMIGRAHTEALARSFQPGVVEMVVVPGVGHKDIQESADYEVALRLAGLRAQAPY